MRAWRIYNGTYVDGNSILKDVEFTIVSDEILFGLHNHPEVSINLHGRVIMPTFINSFDNLLATYVKYESKKSPYHNWYMWDNEVKSSKLFEERMLLEKEDLYFLGSYKNIFSGVTFVVDPIPKFVFEDLLDELDIDLLPDFGISHSPVSYSLNWGKGIKEEFEYAQRNNVPFLIKVSEGFDRESKDSIKILEQMGVLDEHTVLIHGISLTDEDIEIIAHYNCSFVWCPEVNEYIFHQTAPIQKILQHNILVGLGTGSAMHGNTNLFSTIRVAKKYIPDSKMIFQMLLENPIKMFFLDKKKSF
ncbi:MAG: amidohydrolase family protein [Leptospiraceae bacterium]|nr:amidohydrolase family protein [Leptospiraceae bacterium]MDW7976092.1 amidohydrolase family protein [Leptospiraceae bacterium]